MMLLRKRKPYGGKNAKFFISYAQEDKDVVLEIVNRMKADGYQVFYVDRDVENFESQAKVCIDYCDYVIRIHSDKCISSEPYKYESMYASGKGKESFTVYLEYPFCYIPPLVRSSSNIEKYLFDDDEKFYEALYLRLE